MLRFLYRTVNIAQNTSISVYASCVMRTKCENGQTPVFRFAIGCGVRALSTSVRLSEKKNDVASSNQEHKTAAAIEVDPKEILVTRTPEDDRKVIKMAQQSEGPSVSQTERLDVKIEPVLAIPIRENTDVAKSGKESLLDLLGAMKVEITNKRKLKTLKMKQRDDSTDMPKRAAMESTISMFRQATVEASSLSETLDPELLGAASAAATALPNHSQAESELLKQLRQHETITEAQKKGDMSNLGVIIADMKVGKHSNRKNVWPANQIRFDDDGRGYTHDRGITSELDGVRRKRKLFTGKRLNIFPSATEEGVISAVARPTLWDMEFANQLSQSINQMPRNGLEEMIQWTKEGKMCQYPITNEAGLEEEASVSFYEHIFLEKHLAEGFPSQGPVRHFMEVVVAGLSRNPHLTVQQKKEHISWFRDYFQQKEEVLKEADIYLN